MNNIPSSSSHPGRVDLQTTKDRSQLTLPDKNTTIPAIKALFGLLLDVVLLPVRVGSYERINDRGSMTDFDFGTILVLPIFVCPILLTLAVSGLFLPWAANALLIAGLYAFSPVVRFAIVGSKFMLEFAKDKFMLKFHVEQSKMLEKENDGR